MPSGPVYAALAYICWGLFPLYIKQIAHVPALEVVVHRSVWSLVFVLALLAVVGRFGRMRQVLRQPRVLGVFAVSALLLAINWLLYVWAVNGNRLLDASLGYFINPLFNVLLGYLVLHERPRRWQWVAVALAAAGVVWLTVALGQLPWVSLALALSFAVYGLLRKTAQLGALEGLALETLLLAPLTVGALAYILWRGDGAFLTGHSRDNWLLLLAGPLTAIPLLMFAAGARRVSLATLGLLQYLGPSIQFVLGVWLYHEPFSALRGVGFALIWCGLLVYSAESLLRYRRATGAATTPA